MQNITPQKLYKGWQKPFAWRSSARRLAAAAEDIFKNQAEVEQVFDEALIEAHAELDRMRAAGDRPLQAMVKAPESNYLPGQLLYALAVENTVKGLCVATNPSLIGKDKLDALLARHDLNHLIAKTGIRLSDVDSHFLQRLTQVIEWAGRYPIAKDISRHKAGIHPILSTDQFLGDPQEANENLRKLFERLLQELNKLISENDDGYSIVVDLSD